MPGDGMGVREQGLQLAERLLQAERRLTERLSAESFHSTEVQTVYNPLVYAAAPHEQYIRRYANSAKRVVFVGMNPGPFGMCQNGVSYCAVNRLTRCTLTQSKY